MKTVTLEEALKKSSKAPLRERGSSRKLEDGDGRLVCQFPFYSQLEDKTRVNMALLAHCYNVLPEMVAMIKGVIELGERELGVNDYPSSDDKPNQHGGRWAYRHEEILALLRPILTKATTITLPQ